MARVAQRTLVTSLVVGALFALVVALSHRVHVRALGVRWFVLIRYVPLVCVSRAMIFLPLLRRGMFAPRAER